MAKKGHIPWNHGKKLTPLSEETKKKISMALMGNKWGIGNKNALGHKVSDETKKIMSQKKIGLYAGNKQYGWKEDRSLLKDDHRDRGGQLHREWSKRVKERDKVCRIADINCDNRLEAHHILGWARYPELRYDINNGITLCHHHHPRKRKEEMELSSYFQQLVAEMK